MVNRFFSLVKEAAKMVPKVVFVLGPPGAGKGTQCSNIVKRYGYAHLSAGDLLREERNNPGSQYGELIDKYIKDGKIVPVEITCDLLVRAMEKSGEQKFLIDGFPRNQNNLDGWNSFVGTKAQLLFVLYFDCPLEVCTDRCLKRGEAGSGRADDNEESMKKRITTFLTETKPIIEYYEKLSLVKSIDATKPPEQVFERVKEVFDSLVGDM